MKVLAEIAKTTYQLTFDSEVEYNWVEIAQLFIESDNVYQELVSKSLITNDESRENVLYWQDIFFMELAEQSQELDNNEPLIKKLKVHSLFISNQQFISNLPNASTETGREMLIDEMISNKDADELIPDEMIEDVLKKKSRDELRESFKDWNKKPSKRIKYQNIKYIVAVAAILIFIVTYFYPFRYTQTDMQNYYASNFDQFEISIPKEINSKYNSQTRSISSLNFDEYDINKFNQFKQKLKDLGVSKNEKTDLLFFLAVAQLNTGETSKAIDNLEYLRKIGSKRFTEAINFNLAVAYFYAGEKEKSIQILEMLKQKGNKYSKFSRYLIDEIK